MIDTALYWYGVFWAVLSCAAGALLAFTGLIELYFKDREFRSAFMKWYAERLRK